MTFYTLHIHLKQSVVELDLLIPPPDASNHHPWCTWSRSNTSLMALVSTSNYHLLMPNIGLIAQIYPLASSTSMDPHFSRVSLDRQDSLLLVKKLFWKSRSHHLFYFILKRKIKQEKKTLKKMTP